MAFAFQPIMATTNGNPDRVSEAAILELLARTPPAPRDPLRARILQIASGPDAMLAALVFASETSVRRRH